MPKPSKNHPKTDAEKTLKNERPDQSTPEQPRATRGSGKRNKKAYRRTTKGRQPEGGDFREAHAERPTSTLQHASGAFGPGANIFEQRLPRASRASRPGIQHSCTRTPGPRPGTTIWRPIFVPGFPFPTIMLYQFPLAVSMFRNHVSIFLLVELSSPKT